MIVAAEPTVPTPATHTLRLLQRLACVERNGAGWYARCPACDDADRALKVWQGSDGRTLVRCKHGGCGADEVTAALGLTVAALFPAAPGTEAVAFADRLTADEALDMMPGADAVPRRLWAPDDAAAESEREPERPTRWRLDELWADDVVMRPPPPIVPRLVWAARSTLLAAAEKSGKSTLVGYMAACVSQGWPFLDEACERGTVLIVGLEEYLGDVARRLRAFGADPERVYLVDRLPGDARAKPAALRAHVEATGAILVVLDTLIAYGDGIITDSASSAQTGPLVQQLTAVAHETGVGLVVNHHARRADGRYRDSSAIGGAVDVIAEVFQPEKADDADPSLRQVRLRGRVPVRDFALRFDGDTYHVAHGPGASPEERVGEFVRANPGCSVRAVRAAVNCRAEDVDQALTRLLAAGRLVDDGGPQGRAFRWVNATQHSTQHDQRLARQAAPTSPVSGLPSASHGADTPRTR